MKFFGIATTLAALAGVAVAQDGLSEYCGHQCQAGNNPTTVLSGDLKRVDVSYQCGGKIVIQDDCNFSVENFYVSPEPRNAHWSCKGPGYVGLSITHADRVRVSGVDPNAPTTLSYDINNTMYDTFCHASLIQDCQDFLLADEDNHVICQALNVNPNAPGRNGGSSSGSSTGGSSSGSSNGASTGGTSTGGASTGSNNNSKPSTSTTGNNNNGKKTSDATTAKWSMALLGLSSLAAFLLA